MKFKWLKLSCGLRTKVDVHDYEMLKNHKWRSFLPKLSKTRYVARATMDKNKNRTHFLLHRVILNAPKHLQVDHINGDGLDNRRCNIRLVTRSQNMGNMQLRNDSLSGIRGVTWDKTRKCWRTRIMLNRKEIFLGRFKFKKEAQKVYQEASIKYFGKYALINRNKNNDS